MSSLRHTLPTLLILNLLSATLTLDGAASAATGVPGKYPQASTRKLVVTELEGLSDWDLQVMRNEIVARKGFIFDDREIAAYFRSQSWYTPSSTDVSEQLSETERANIVLITFQKGKLAYKNQKYRQAHEEFLFAARNRNVGAVNHLGMMYEQGYGVDKNLKLAQQFYQLAAKEGDDWAQKRLKEVFGEGEEVPPRTAERSTGERMEKSECATITKGSLITGSFRNTTAPCYRYAVASGNLSVLTLKPLHDGTDVDLVVYNDTALSEKLATSSASGSSTELLTLSIPSATQYVYVKVVKHAGGDGDYALYAEQIDLAGKALEVAAKAAGQAILRWGWNKFWGTTENENASTSTWVNIDRAFTVTSSLLQGKSLATTSRNLLIHEVKRSLIGNGFMSDFAVNYTVLIVDEIYKHY